VKTWPARRNAENRAQHFRREAGSAHAEQDDIAEPIGLDPLREAPQPLDRPGHQLRRRHPAKPIGNRFLHRRVAAPRRRVATPQSLRRARRRVGRASQIVCQRAS
jgi:hypothetical protein